MNAQEYYEKGKSFHSEGQYKKAQEYLQKARELASKELPNLKPRQAVVYLAERAYEFFDYEYNNVENEIHNIIKTYSELLAVAQVASFHYQDTTDEVINNVLKPLNLYYDKLEAWVFNTIQDSVIEKFPNKFYYIQIALTLFDNTDELINAVHKELSNKLKSIFVIELYRSIKKHYERILKTYYPNEYNFLDKEGLDGLWNELYGRSIKLIFDCLQSLGLEISLIDMEKIIYGNIDVFGNEVDINIINHIVFGNSNIIIEKKQDKMGNNKNSKFEDFKVHGDATITRAIEDNADYKRFDVVGDLNITTLASQDEQIDLNNLNKKIDELCTAIRKSDINNEISVEMMLTLKEAIQAIQDKNVAKQKEAKRKLSEYWNIAKNFLQGTANATKIIEFLMKVLS